MRGIKTKFCKTLEEGPLNLIVISFLTLFTQGVYFNLTITLKFKSTYLF